MLVDQNDVTVQLILASKNANRSISGYIISSDRQSSTACRFNNPIQLAEDKSLSDAHAVIEKLNGHPSNNGEQISILTGQCSCRCKYFCSSCLMTLDKMNQRPKWIQRHRQESWLQALVGVDGIDEVSRQKSPPDVVSNIKCFRVPLANLTSGKRSIPVLLHKGKIIDLTSVLPDACLRVGDKQIDRTAAEFQTKTAGGKIQLKKAEYIEINESLGSLFNTPLLVVPVHKDNGGPMHIRNGCVTHMIDTINSSILVKEEKMSFWQGAIASLAKAKDKLVRLKQSPQYKEFHKDSRGLARQARKKMSESERDKTSESKAEKLKQEAGQLEKESFSHALNTNCGSLNCQIKGLEDGYIPFLKNNIKTDSKSKRPRGRGGRDFLKSVEYDGCGSFMPQHTGLEITNGNSINFMQHFQSVGKRVIGMYAPDPDRKSPQSLQDMEMHAWLKFFLVLSFIFCSGSGLTRNSESLIHNRLQHITSPNHIEGKR